MLFNSNLLNHRSYSPPVPTCNAKTCNAPDITDGRLDTNSDTINPEQTFKILCNPGYVLSTSNNKIKCVTNNIFDPFNLPTCNGKDDLFLLLYQSAKHHDALAGARIYRDFFRQILRYRIKAK